MDPTTIQTLTATRHDPADAYEVVAPVDGYHLTEVGHLSTVGRSHGVPVGEHLADELSAYHYVAPRDYCDEWVRRMAHEYGRPASDEGLKAAIEAHRRGDPLPPAEGAGWCARRMRARGRGAEPRTDQIVKARRGAEREASERGVRPLRTRARPA